MLHIAFASTWGVFLILKMCALQPDLHCGVTNTSAAVHQAVKVPFPTAPWHVSPSSSSCPCSPTPVAPWHAAGWQSYLSGRTFVALCHFAILWEMFVFFVVVLCNHCCMEFHGKFSWCWERWGERMLLNGGKPVGLKFMLWELSRLLTLVCVHLAVW